MGEEIKKTLPQFWHDFLIKEFERETDRAAVVLTASLFDNAIGNLLKKFLLPCSGDQDELFDVPNSPLGSFHSKIQTALRLGLISQRFARDLNLIRKIRNEFAHNVSHVNLDEGRVKDYLTTLLSSSDIIRKNPRARAVHPSGSRGDFLMIAGLMLFHVNSLIEDQIDSIQSITDEWLYSWVYKGQEQQQLSAPEVVK